jgi:hypothetical protein
MRDFYNRETLELEQGQTNTLVMIADKPVETKRVTASVGWKLLQTAFTLKGIQPTFEGSYYGKTNDWFYSFPISENVIVGFNDYRLTKRLRDDNGNFLPRQGPKVGKNAFAYYEISPRETQANLTSTTVSALPKAVNIQYDYIRPTDSTLNIEPNRIIPLQIALMPKQRPVNQSLLLHNLTSDGTPWTYATGCVDTNGVPRSMVLQRSFGDITGPWQNAYTNSITAENPYGSISFVDGEAKGKSAFYRVVGMQEAAKAASQQTSTSNPAQ